MNRFELDNLLGFAISRTAYLLRKTVIQRINEKGYDIIAGEELAILARVFEKPGMSQGEISDLTIKNKTTVTRILNSMEKKGLVKRVRDMEDKRVFRIHMTRQGELSVNEFIPQMNRILEAASVNVTQADLDTTLKTLNTLYDEILKQTKPI